MRLNNALTQAGQVIRSLGERFGNAVIDTGQQAVLGLANALPASIPYRLANANYAIRERLLPHVPQSAIRDFERYHEARSQVAPKQRLGFDLQYGDPNAFYNMTEKSFSAQPQSFFEPPPSDPSLEPFRQRVIQGSSFTPEAQKFLQQIPVVQAPSRASDPGTAYGLPHTFGNRVPYPTESWEAAQNQLGTPHIRINPNVLPPNAPEGIAEQVLLHEFVHELPRQVGANARATSVLNDQAGVVDPFLLDIAKTYFGTDKTPSPEEFYATMAEVLGPSIIYDPQVGQLYQHIFNPPSRFNEATVVNPRGSVVLGATRSNRKGKKIKAK